MTEIEAFVRARIGEDVRHGRMSSQEADALNKVLAPFDRWDPNDRSRSAAALGTVIRAVAAIWRDHPDYRQDWAPRRHRSSVPDRHQPKAG